MEKKLIVTEKEYDALLFSIKKENPSSSFKIVHPDDFLSFCSFSYKDDLIPYLISSFGYDYDQAKKCAALLRVADIRKNEKLSNIFDTLSQRGLISYDPYGTYELAHSSLFFFEMKEDNELHSLAKRRGFPFQDIRASDLGISMNYDETVSHPPLLSFKNKFEQFSYIYSDMRKRLIDKENINRFCIHVKDETDLFYVRLCSSLFGIPSFMKVSHPFIGEISVKKKIAEIHEKRSFSFSSEEKNDAVLSTLFMTISHYHLEELPFEKGYASLLEILSSLSRKEVTNDRGVLVTTDFTIDPSKTVYVTDFVNGSFYRVYEDKNVVSDKELDDCSANASYILTSIDRRKKLNYIRYSNIVFLSRVEEHLSDAIYSSQFMGEFPLYKKDGMKKVSRNHDGVYTSKARNLLFAKEFDDAFYFQPFEGYRSYDSSYKKIDGYVSPYQDKPYSVTNLESYINCPFRYLLSEIIPSTSDDYHNMYLGTLIHKIMERVYDDSFSFDQAFQEGVEEYKRNMISHEQSFGDVENAYLQIYYPHLERIAGELRAWKKESSIRREIPEKTIEWDLLDGEKKYHFKGRIDKIIQFGKDVSSYYYIIDYKTGGESFIPEAVFLGKSTQLPLYFYALEQDEKTKEELTAGAHFGGFGIQQMYSSSLKKAYYNSSSRCLEEKVFYANSAFRGVVLAFTEEAFWNLADKTSFKEDKNTLVSTGNGAFLSGTQNFVTFDEGSVLKKTKKDVRIYTLRELVDDAISGTIQTIHKIENAEFPIAPTNCSDITKAPNIDELTCKYCPYKDVCYRNAYKDCKDYSDEVKKHFAKGGDENGR